MLTLYEELVMAKYKTIGLDGRNYDVEWNGHDLAAEVDYINLRKTFGEEAVLGILNFVKQVTKRKMAVVFGNCQTLVVRNFLRCHKIVQREYFFLYLPAVCDYHEEFIDQLHEGFWSLCDLFIAQRVKKDNAFGEKVGTMQFLNYLPETTKVIWIPNLYYVGYWPQYIKNERNVDTHIHGAGRFMNGDRYIDEFMLAHDKVSMAEVEEYIRGQTFIKEDEVRQWADKSLDSLKEHEWPCDVRMADVVEEYLWDTQLFYASNHPVNLLLAELIRRILDFMDVKLNVPIAWGDYDTPRLVGQDIPIYPKVAEILGLQEQIDDYYANNCMWMYHGDWLNFNLEYVKWIWRDKIRGGGTL